MRGDHFKALADGGASPERLASAFLRAYFGKDEPVYPLNPFAMLRKMGVAFTFRPFGKLEGIYVPSEDADDIPVVGININKPITRQRFTAAHELCHHLKDAGTETLVCASNAQSAIERYAESFAAELLMPSGEMRRQIEMRKSGGYVSFDDALAIAEYFGVSFQACLNRLAYRFHVIQGDTSPQQLKRKRDRFKPAVKRKELGWSNVALYRQLFDAAADYLLVDYTLRVRQLFKAEYVFHDSRMEGVDVDPVTAGEIVVDLRLNGSGSRYSTEENANLVEVAGLSIAYDYVFDTAASDAVPNVYDTKAINQKLYSMAPHPDLGGRYRETNTLVLGARFDTSDYRRIPELMFYLDGKIQAIVDGGEDMTVSQYVEAVLAVHYRLTVIHAYRDGNGRTSRAFVNLMLARRGLPVVLFRGDGKDAYKKALAFADESGDLSSLFEVYYKQMLESFSVLGTL